MTGIRSSAALILAAGYSSRMGALKPLLPLGRSTVIEEAVGRFLRAGVENVRVVVGHRAYEIIPVLDRLGVRWILNEQYDRGMFSSVLAGAKSLESDIHAVFVLPADIPLIKPRTIEMLIDAYGANPRGIVYPRFLGVRGHPPLISRACLPQEDSWDEPGGLRALLNRYEDKASDVDVADQSILMDCDTPSDYSELQAYCSREDIPTREECLALWNLWKVPEKVIAHSKLVAETACTLAEYLNRKGLNLDPDLIHAAGYLHDVAKGQPDHASAAMKLLQEYGYPRVGSIVASHMDIQPRTSPLGEAELIYLVDKLTEGDRLVSLENRMQAMRERFSDEPMALKAAMHRLENAKIIRECVEDILGLPLEKIIP